MKDYVTEIFKIALCNCFLKLDNQVEFSNQLKKYSKQEGRQVSNFGGYQSKDLNLSDKNFLSFIELVERQSNLFAKYIGLKPNLKMQNMWLNINSYKDSNLGHIHGESILSGVYYIDVPKDSGDIHFRPPYALFLPSYWPDKETEKFTPFNSSHWEISPQNNQLIIFPAWLEHAVTPNKNKTKKRITVAFNMGRL